MTRSWLEEKYKALKLTYPYVCGGGHTKVGETHCSNSNLTYNQWLNSQVLCFGKGRCELFRHRYG